MMRCWNSFVRRWPGILGFRVFGVGLWIEVRRQVPALFAERHKLGPWYKRIRLGRYTVEVLLL
jgi:hypothetical protein